MIIWMANFSYLSDTLEQTHKYPCHYHTSGVQRPLLAFQEAKLKAEAGWGAVWPKFVWKSDSENNFLVSFRIVASEFLVFYSSGYYLKYLCTHLPDEEIPHFEVLGIGSH